MGFFVYAALGVVLAMLVAMTKRWQGRPRVHIETLKGKHVVITGGSSGIGLAIAHKCAGEGAFVTLIARTLSKLEDARGYLSGSLELPPDSIVIKAVDVTNAEAVALAIKESFEWRPIDVLVCCAGHATSGLLEGTKVKMLDQIARTNLLGCVFPIHAALPLMKTRSLEHPSSIVIMSSLSALMFLYGSNMYTPTKFALKGLAEMLRFELLPWNIRVNLICPGFTETPMLAEVESDHKLVNFTQELYKFTREEIELPEQVAELTVEGLKKGEFLVSTTLKGTLIAVLGRGCIPSDSFGVFLMELVLMIPMRIMSFFWVCHAKRMVRISPYLDKF